MKTTHTPGPWKTNYSERYPEYDFVTGKNGEIICQFFSKSEEDYSNKEANAKLIAAAPELLEALRELHDLLEENLPTWYLGLHHIKANIAIKKATGTE
ncbi:MAG: hypothetical protein RBT57_02970 [Paludibacter sp.]|jgi:hypothetical protein|nr:hypothetical protein [Paludibacter sp.]